MPILYHYKQFKDSGKLIEAEQNGDFFKSLFGFSPYKKINSMNQLKGNDLTKFKEAMKIGENGLSEYSMADIRAKSSMLGFGDSLTTELTALAKDADLTAKAATGKLSFAEALKDGTISTDELGDALKNHLQTNGLEKKLNELSKAAERGGKDYQDAVQNIIEGSDDVANAMVQVENQVSGENSIFSSAANFGKGLLSSLKTFAKTIAPYAAVAAVAYGSYKLWDHSQTGYTRAKEKAETSASTYSEDKTNLKSLQQELDTTKSKIEELNATKEQNGGLSLTDEAELSRLEQENAQLERKVAIQKQLTEISAQAASSDAQKAANTAQTYWDHLKEQNGGGFFGTLKSIPQYFGAKRIEKDGKVSIIKDKNTWEKENGGKGNTTLENQTKANIKTLKDYQSQLEDIETQLGSSDLTKGERKSLQKQQKELSENIANTKQTLSAQTDQLQQWIDASYDADGKLESGASKYVDNWNKIINNVNNTIEQKTKTQIDASNLDTYFNSSSGSAMKEYLENIVKEGGSAQDALDAFRESGMRLKDINVSKNGFLTYFEDVKRQAEEAKKATEDYTASVSDVTSATESVNQDKDWSTIQSAYKSAKEALNEGKTGIDDFQTMAKFLNPKAVKKYAEQGGKYTADAYQKAFQEAMGTADRWFGDDEANSMKSFVEDFKNKGLFNVTTDDMGLWDIEKNFKTTSEAANKFGMSVQSVETMLHSLEAYGYDFSDITFSTEGLNEYKNSLDGIKTILDEMEDGAKKDRLQKLYEGWDSEYEKYQDDMDTLSDDVIVRIKFEYDLASVQQQIDEIQSSWDNGDKSAKTGASLLVAKEKELSLLEKQLKYTAGQDSGYDASKNITSTLSEKLSKTSNKKEIKSLQEQKSAVLDLQNAYNTFKVDGGTLNWSDYLKSDQATSTLNDIISKTKMTKEELANLLGVDVGDLKIDVDANTTEAEDKLKGIAANNGKTIVMDVNANTDQIQNAIDSLQDGQTLKFNATAKIDGQDIQKEISAENINGEIHYKTVIDNNEVELVKNQDGTFRVKTVVDDSDFQSKKSDIENNPVTQKVKADTEELENSVNDAKSKIENDEITIKGKIDLTNRPQIPAETMKQAGWENVGDGTATVYSSSYSNEAGDKTIVVTPILPDGQVLSPSALDSYAGDLLNGGSDTQGIELKTYIGDDSVKKAERYSEALHKVQEAYYMGSDAQKASLTSLQDYSAEQLKSINLYDNQRQAGESALTSVMNSLNIGKESASEFIDVLTQMGMVHPEVDMDVKANDDATPTLASLMNTLYAVPTDLTTELLANDQASPAAISLASTLTGIPEEKLTSINATDGASGVLAAIISELTGIPAETITTLLANDNASAVASMVTGSINGVPNNHDTTLNGKDNVTPAAASAKASLGGVKDKTVTIGGAISSTLSAAVAKAKSMIASVTGGGGLLGTAHVNGTAGLYPIPKLSSRALAMGTLEDSSWLKPQWMTQQNDVALTGEKGQELVVYGNRWWTVGDNGAEFASIPQGSVIFNARQTKELFSKGFTNSRGTGNPNLPGMPAFVSGTAYRLGTSTSSTTNAKKKTSSSSSSTKKSSSRSSTKSSSSSGNSSSKSSTSSNSSSSSSDSSKETKETLDWIETKLDRIKRDIDLIDKTASSTYKTWSERNKALVSELSQVSNELSVQQQSYDYYIQKANSIGLDGTWAAKVRDGLISIDEITDEDLKTKISDYKTW